MADVDWIREPQILSDSGHLERALAPDGIHPSGRDKNDRAESQESGDNTIIFASFFQCSRRLFLVPSSGFLACSLEFSSNDILLCFAERRRRKEGRKGFEHQDFSHRKAVCVHLKELLGQPERERERGWVMAPKRKTARSSKFADDAPWRAPQGEKPIPRISQGVVFPVRQGPNFSYAMSIMKVGFLSFFACLFVCLFVCSNSNPPINQLHHGFYESLCSITVHVVEEDFLAS
jgi:hypothetical protein